MQTLKRGASGTDVELLQRLLCKRGYHVGADGIFGNDTELAVRKFQKDYVKDKAKKRIKDIARDLIKLYAQRRLKTTFP